MSATVATGGNGNGNGRRPPVSVCGDGGLWDIRDPHAFVHATIRRARLILSTDELDELHAEGMAILYQLAKKFQPHIAGHEHEGRFSGYAAMYLPRKLGDAWHRMNPHHLLVTREDGGRKWDYRDRAVSLEAVLADDPDRSDLLLAKMTTGGMGDRVRKALAQKWAQKIDLIANIADLLSQGATQSDVAQMLGLTGGQVQEAIGEIQTVEARVRT